MSTFTGGVIPTVKVSSNTELNTLATGVVQNVADTSINVAIDAVLFGVSPESFGDVLSSVITSGLISIGETAVTNIIDKAIVNSGALGPFGPLASSLASSAVSSLSGSLLNSITGSSSSSGSSESNRWFPGADSDDPEADYNGNLYTGGPSGSDVVFSIKSSENNVLS